MVAAIIILCVLLAAAVAFIFWLFHVIKNTFSAIAACGDLLENKLSTDVKTAYNGKYYPATVISTITFNAEQDMKIVDWSKYEDYKIVGFIVHTTDTMEQFMGENLNEDDKQLLSEPLLIPNALVYEVREGEYFWKLAP